MFYYSKHIHYCSCQWCQLDVGVSGTENKNQNTASISKAKQAILLSSFNDKVKSFVNSFTSDDEDYSCSYMSANQSGDDDSYSSPSWGEGTIEKHKTRDNNTFNLSFALTDKGQAPDNQLTMNKGVKHYPEQSNLSVSHYGSLLNNDQAISNYSQFSIEGASEISHPQEGNRRNNVNKENALHRQWGLMFNQDLLAVENIHCRIIEHKDMASWVKLAYAEASKHNIPNYRGARIKTVSSLNVKQFRHLLQDYKFSRVIDYVEFGFPLDLDYHNFTYIGNTDNHKSATLYPASVTKYLESEIRHQAIVGPFQTPPFEQLHVSPMMTRPKPDGSRRVIVDLSWPKGCGVNSRIPDNEFDSNPCALKYPTIDNIVQAIVDTGNTAFLFKVDLQRAYRNLRTDPRDLSVLGLQWGPHKYVDVSVPFGLKSGASACQSVTDCVTHLLSEAGYWTCSLIRYNWSGSS